MLPKAFYINRLICIVLFGFFTITAFGQQPIPDWVKDIGGNGESKVSGIAVDKFDNIYVSGNFQGTLTIDHSGVSNPIDLISNGSYDIFIAKYTSDGKLLWAKSIGGSDTERGHVVTTDRLGNALFVGSFSSSSINLGSFTLTNKGGLDGFMAKYDSNGNLLWAYGMGSYNEDEIKSVKTNSNNEIILKWTIKNSDCLTESTSLVKVYNYGTPTLSLTKRLTINEGQA